MKWHALSFCATFKCTAPLPSISVLYRLRSCCSGGNRVRRFIQGLFSGDPCFPSVWPKAQSKDAPSGLSPSYIFRGGCPWTALICLRDTSTHANGPTFTSFLLHIESDRSRHSSSHQLWKGGSGLHRTRGSWVTIWTQWLFFISKLFIVTGIGCRLFHF